MANVNTIGHTFQRARKAHTCWGCGDTIEKGERYWRCIALVDGKFASRLKTCRAKCECIPDMIDQNQGAITLAVLYAETLPGYLKDNPDTFKD